MADEPENPDIDDELELTDVVEPDEDDQIEDDRPNKNEIAADEEGDDEEEETLTFGDDLAEEKPDDSNLIKHLREELKRTRKEAAELARSAPRQEPVELGPEPTLADSDYDEDKFKAEWRAWDKRRQEAEQRGERMAEQQQKEAEAWQAELRRYNEAKESLGFRDVQDAEEIVVSTFSPVQQGAMVKATDNPARVMYALAKHPDRLAQLAAISDPVKFIAAVAKLEGTLKVVKKRKAPEPEKIERGGAGLRGSDKMLEKLEKEAERTGDRTKVVDYKRKMKAKG